MPGFSLELHIYRVAGTPGPRLWRSKQSREVHVAALGDGVEDPRVAGVLCACVCAGAWVDLSSYCGCV